MRISLPLIVLFLLLAPDFLSARQVCDQFSCPSVQNVPQTPSTSVQQFEALVSRELQTAKSRGESSGSAVRVSVGNGCGSGSVCGLYRDGCLVLTNAHVAGTRPGSRSRIRAVVDGRDMEYTGVLLQAAYSDRFLTDWAILYVEGLTQIQPVKLSTKKPNNRMYTKGSPGCVWPLVESALIVADIRDNSTLVRWRPNSIGGQSGSGCWDVDDDLQRAILTWSWGGLGAGQQTSEIYRQSKNRTVEGATRTGSEIEVSDTGVVCENGFFTATDLTEFDIWDDGTTPDDDDNTPDNPSSPLTESDVEALREAVQKMSDVLGSSK